MPFDIGLTLFAIVLLLALSAFFNGSETALTAASRARMHALEGEGNPRAGLVNRILSAPEKMIGSVLLGNTLVDVLAAALAANLATQLVGEVGVVYATVIMTMLIVIFSAVLPKTFALAEPDRVALSVAKPMRAVITLLTPVNVALQVVVRALLKLTPSVKDDKANILAAREEIRGTIELQQKEGAVARGDADMLGGVLDLGELRVMDLMVHRTKMTTLNIEDPAAVIVEQVIKSQYTRVPLWRGTPDNIVGILNTKDLLAALAATGFKLDALDVSAIAQPTWFVPDATTANAQLNAFLKRKLQLALVVDEYGEVQGLITLEDILEEIVGQIADEHDTAETMIRPQADGSVNVDGTLSIRDINRQMGWELPDDEATTVAGLVIHEAQTIPEPGQNFTFHGYRFEILRKSRNKITALRVKPVAAGSLTHVPAPTSPRSPRRAATETDAMDGG
ncbi:MAG: HlyC/CorC family transporter [Hyphomicrobiales bacterium]|nr:HlyC/CorC family transporter [Hyphomicrobiales bacterium]